jgi:hypothetical protein
MSKLARLTVPLHASEANDPRASEANDALPSLARLICRS